MNSRSELFGRLYDSQLSIEERELAEPLNYLPVFEASRFLIIEICQFLMIENGESYKRPNNSDLLFIP